MRYSIELRDLIVKVNVFLFFAKNMGGKYRLKPLDWQDKNVGNQCP